MNCAIECLRDMMSLQQITPECRAELLAAIKILEKDLNQKKKVKAYRQRVAQTKKQKKQKPIEIRRTKRSSDYMFLYLSFFGYDPPGDYIPSELTGDQVDDVHHIKADGMGGTKKKPTIENLMGLSRLEHDYFGDRTHFREFLEFAHKNFMETRTPLIETEYADNRVLLEFLNYRRKYQQLLGK